MSDMNKSVQFAAFDYIVFIGVLVGSLGIGAYYGSRGNKTTDEFLLAGRSMSLIPVALSSVATFISSIALLGYTGEVYGQGLSFICTQVGFIIAYFLAMFVFHPMLYPLKLDSINQYIELRFKSKRLANATLLLRSLSSILYIGLCLFAPTLALTAITPISTEVYIIVLGAVVTIYSAYGGMKAVVWTDTIQSVIMLAGIIGVFISSLVFVGGFGKVLSVANEYGRMNAISGGLGLFTRHTTFNLIVMGIVNYTSHFSFDQNVLQRINTMPNIQATRKMMIVSGSVLLFITVLLLFTGLSIFAAYSGCDPLMLGFINRKDQILTYYVMDKMSFIPGISGIFVACLFSGTMSSLSSYLNSLPTMLWKDFVVKFKIIKDLDEAKKTIASKILCAFVGVLMILMALISSKLGGLIQATTVIMGIAGGPVFGVFFLAACIPQCTEKGALAGLAASTIIMAWLGIGIQMHSNTPPFLKFSVDECSNDTLALSSLMSNINTAVNSTLAMMPESDQPSDPSFALYGISYTYISVFGFLLCLLFGTITSFITGKQDIDYLDPRFVVPLFKGKVGRKFMESETNEPMLELQQSKEVPDESIKTQTHQELIEKPQ